MTDWTPRETYLRVRIVPAAEMSAGGIYLPDECRVSVNEAEVLAVGPGLVVGTDNGGYFTPMWAEVGDRVLFQQHSFQRTDADGKEGIVREDDLLAIIPAGCHTVQPHNDWVAVSIEAGAKESQGGIILADRARKRPQCGKILDYGPGKFRRTGQYFGTRKTIEAIMGLELPPGVLLGDKYLAGRKVWWGDTSEVLEAGTGDDWFLLVRASDLLLIEGEDDEGL